MDQHDANLRRFRRIFTELDKLERELQDEGERDLGDAVKRARRELELVERQGIVSR